MSEHVISYQEYYSKTIPILDVFININRKFYLHNHNNASYSIGIIGILLIFYLLFIKSFKEKKEVNNNYYYYSIIYLYFSLVDISERNKTIYHYTISVETGKYRYLCYGTMVFINHNIQKKLLYFLLFTHINFFNCKQ